MKYEENEQDKYLTLIEASKLLNIHPNTLRNWDANGALKGYMYRHQKGASLSQVGHRQIYSGVK
ncbi:MAG: helix-turn-helix domain-containing protein [Clostridia bacterium]|nr:helix-turn-helix domain-containing protein [Clostridia bacterium]